jgi:hypothetical protein
MYIFIYLKEINKTLCNFSTETIEYKCAFWNFNLSNGAGDWDTTSCSYEFSNSKHFCYCNHTTNFALLIVR